MEPKGSVLLNKEFVHTTIWPGPQFTFKGIVDLEKEYKKALAGKMVTVLDIGVDGGCYLVYCESEKTGPFIWNIEKGDTRGFIPIIKQNGVVMPAGLSAMEKVAWMAEHMAKKYESENNTEEKK